MNRIIGICKCQDLNNLNYNTLKFISNLEKRGNYSDTSSRIMTSSASTKFLQVSQIQSVIFSAVIHLGNLRLLHCLQNSGIVYCTSTSISTDIILLPKYSDRYLNPLD